MSRPRSDAERNRARLLDVAVDLFAEHGDQVQMGEVARAAQVGVGTLYRHFPTRQALVEAVAEQRFSEILAFAENECLPNPDTRAALTCFLTHVAQMHQTGRGLSGAIEATFGSTAPRGPLAVELLAIGDTLIRRGHADGTVRADITVDDLYMLVGALAMISRGDVGDWRRFIDIILDGIAPR
ncbi:helix-turn-helix domain-containing protein [Microbispora rosea]|uniref:TetR/AcrR family transcriptional regulator n=1 Tax=Microbispora rosea TaxID=58117 RepID=UPI0034306D9D